MNTLSAKEIKRRGITAVDKALKNGAVYIIKNNRPQYVVLSDEQYHALLREEERASLERLLSSLRDIRHRKVKKYKSAAELIAKLKLES